MGESDDFSVFAQSAAQGYDASARSDVEPIDNVDEFVSSVLATRDAPQISDDDDLAPLSHGIVAHIAGQCIKFGPCFSSEAAAREHAAKISIDGLLETTPIKMYEWVPFGPEPLPSAEQLVRVFVEDFNDRHTRMEERIKAVHDHNKRLDDAQGRAQAAAIEEPPPAAAPGEAHATPPPSPEPAAEAVTGPDTEAANKIMRQLQNAVKRGDIKRSYVDGQRFMVLGHMRAPTPAGHWLLRYCGVFADGQAATDHAKSLFNRCPGKKRFDYIVADLYNWKPFPIDFMSNIRQIHCTNPNVQKFYEASNFKASDEYASMLKEVEESMQQPASAAEEQEPAEAETEVCMQEVD